MRTHYVPPRQAEAARLAAIAAILDTLHEPGECFGARCGERSLGRARP
jgi:hypothetical protein